MRQGGRAQLDMLSAKITITTDLGEAFLAVDIGLMVELEIDDGSGNIVKAFGSEYIWKGRNGMRALEVSIRISLSQRKPTGRIMKMLLRPSESRFAVESFADVLEKKYGEGEGGVVAVRSLDICSQNNGVGMAERIFNQDNGKEKNEVCIFEETGESIARHIWYARQVRRLPRHD